MLRRNFLTRAAALVAAGVAVDQLELLERLAHTRTFFAGWRAPVIGPALRLLNGFQSGYVVSGRDWRSDDAFAHAARLTGRDVFHDLARDVWRVGEKTRNGIVIDAPTFHRANSSAGAFGPIVRVREAN